jgi:hypothetical protein
MKYGATMLRLAEAGFNVGKGSFTELLHTVPE